MAIYTVRVRERRYYDVVYRVEADSQDDAADKVRYYGGDEVSAECDYTDLRTVESARPAGVSQ